MAPVLMEGKRWELLLLASFSFPLDKGSIFETGLLCWPKPVHGLRGRRMGSCQESPAADGHDGTQPPNENMWTFIPPWNWKVIQWRVNFVKAKHKWRMVRRHGIPWPWSAALWGFPALRSFAPGHSACSPSVRAGFTTQYPQSPPHPELPEETGEQVALWLQTF